MTTFYKTILFIAAISGMIAGIFYFSQPQEPIKGQLPQVKEIKSFSLINSAGGSFELKNLLGKWSIISIGYTHCPDICPSTLNLYKLSAQLLKQDKDTQFIFISVDPKRDTPDQLNQYVKYFNPKFIGLTGSDESLRNFTRQIFASYIIPKNPPANYEVGHTTYLHIINSKAELVAILRPPFNEHNLVTTIKSLKQY